jgi:hypothetical protein
MINKIKVSAKRHSEPVLKDIFTLLKILAIYAVDFDIKGYRMKEEFLDVMTLKQKILVTTAAIKSGQKHTKSLDNSWRIWNKNFQVNIITCTTTMNL